MLNQKEVERAVDLQARGYQLLQFLEKGMNGGWVIPETAHAYATMPDSAYAWIERHYLNLPPAARPERDDLRSFSNLFSTYLTNTFDLEANPGERRYSPGAHCFCPMCSWMVRVPHLTPKKIGPADKKTAERMERSFIRSLAFEAGVSASDDDITKMLRNPELREPIGLCTYAADLLKRLEGLAVGAASLALWRSFAWTPQGSPKKKFTLSAKAIMSAQQTLKEHLMRRFGNAEE